MCLWTFFPPFFFDCYSPKSLYKTVTMCTQVIWTVRRILQTQGNVRQGIPYHLHIYVNNSEEIKYKHMMPCNIYLLEKICELYMMFTIHDTILWINIAYVNVISFFFFFLSFFCTRHIQMMNPEDVITIQ